MRILLTSKTIWNYSSRLFSTNKYKMAAYVKDVYDKLKSSEVESDYKLVKIKGIPQNPTFKVDEYESLIENFESRDGDVFLVTYVKAGTTWTQQIVHLLTRDGEAGGFYSETAPWLEALTSDMIGPREAPTWSLEKVNAVPLDQRRYFKSHANVEHLPNQKSPKKVKVIYVARNPKDTVVSLYHHAKSKPEFGYTGGFDKFCEIFLAGQAENGDWFTHVLDWYNECKAHPDTHLFLQYEEMYQNSSAATQRIADFLGMPVTPEIVQKVVANSSIDEMRAKASIGLNHLRKGGYGGWRTSFTVAMSEFFDDVYLHRMEGTGLKFNFGPNSHGVDVIM